MKSTLILLILFGFTNTQCTSQQKTENHNKNSSINQKKQNIDKIEITEQTRGTNRIITFTQNSESVNVNGTIENSEISSSRWENIVKQVGLLDLQKISSYESPTTGRFSDRALASTISIISNGNTYTSASFDAGIPPKELEGLYILLKGKGVINKKPKPRIR